MSIICRGNSPQEFAVNFCHENLPQEFAVAFCCENLPQEMLYIKNKTLTNGRTYWEYAQRRSGDAYNAKIALDAADRFVAETRQRTHAADPEGNDLLKEIAGIKRSAKDTAGKA